MNQYQYNPWPLDYVPEHLQRPEIKQLKERGYKFNDPREITDIFEEKIAKYTGAPYAVAVDSCTNALYLSFMYFRSHGNCLFDEKGVNIELPSKTYISVPQSALRTKYRVKFIDYHWKGMYKIYPLKLYDSAARFTKNMYIKESLMCLSFQIKKRIPIGKGGMILTDNKYAYEWLKKARYEGRDLTVSYDKDEFNMMGINAYMTPEDSARGIILFDEITKNGELEFEDMWGSENYPDLIEKQVLKKWGYE